MIVAAAAASSPDYPWYSEVSGSDLQQGDLIHQCPVIIPSAPGQPPDEPGEPEKGTAEILDYDVVVMTQSCDLKHEKVRFVLVCPFFPYKKLAEKDDHLASKAGKKELTNGYHPGYHLLAPCEVEGFESEHQVVVFRDALALPRSYLIEVVLKKRRRIRLLPPYREQLSQAFARFFMRVGLPVDIPSL